MMVRRNKFYLILMIFGLSGIFMFGCDGKNKNKDKGKKDKISISKEERNKMRGQISELQERMQVVMETQQCIIRHCPNSVRNGMNDLNREVKKVKEDNIVPAELRKLRERVNVAEEIQVDLLKSYCTSCAK